MLMWVPRRSMCHLASAQIIDSSSCSCVGYLCCCRFICCDLNVTSWVVSYVLPKLRQVPVLHWLASQVIQILLSPGSSWLIVVRHSTLVTSCQIPRNVASCWLVHVGNKASHALVVSGIRTLVNSANFGRKMLIYCTNPWNAELPLPTMATSSWGSFRSFQHQPQFLGLICDVLGNRPLSGIMMSSLGNIVVQHALMLP